MDAAELAALTAKLCSDDLLDQTTAKHRLTAVLTPQVIMQRSTDATLLAAVAQATSPTAHPDARRFVATLLRQTAQSLPHEFGNSTYCHDTCVALVQCDDTGAADIAAHAIAAAMRAIGDEQIADALKDASIDAVLRVAAAASALDTDPASSPLRQGHLARLLSRRFDAALAEGDVLMLANIAALTVAATRHCGATTCLTPNTLAAIQALIGGSWNGDMMVFELVRPFATKAAAAVIDGDASPDHSNTVVAYGPSLADVVQAGADRGGAEAFDAWALAAASLLTTREGAAMALQPPTDRALIGGIKHALQYGGSEAKRAAAAVLASAATSPNPDAIGALWCDDVVWKQVLNGLGAPDVYQRAATWAALAAVLGSGSSVANAFVKLLWSFTPRLSNILMREIGTGEDRKLPPTYGDDADALQSIYRHTRRVAECLLSREWILRAHTDGSDADKMAVTQALDGLNKVALEAGIVVQEAAL